VVPVATRLGSVAPLSAPIPARLGAGASLDVAAGVAAVFLITGGAADFAVDTLDGVTVEAVSSVLAVETVFVVEDFSPVLVGCVVAADAGTAESGAGVAGSGDTGFAVKAVLGAGRGAPAGDVKGCEATLLTPGIFPPSCVQAK